MPEIVVFVIGLAAAIRGADWLGRAAISLAKQYGIPHLVIGATIVSVATTLPELAIATTSSLVNNDPQLALGVILGSPLVNIGIILGLFYLFSQHRPRLGYYSRSINLLIVLSVFLLVISLNRPIGGLISFLLIVLGVLFLILELVINKSIESVEEKIETRFETFLSIFSFTKDKTIFFEFALGVIFLAVGSKFIVDSTFSLANVLDIDEFFISITFLALGTSLPELITSINSLIYKRVSLSVGNLVGASVIDLTIGIGLSTLFTPTNISSPNNLIVFGSLIVISVISLLALLKKLPIYVVGGGLLACSLFFITIFTLLNLT